MKNNCVAQAAAMCASLAKITPKYPLLMVFEKIFNNQNAMVHPRQNLSGKSYYDFIVDSFDLIKKMFLCFVLGFSKIYN